MSIDHLSREIGNLFIRLTDRYGSEWTMKWAERDPTAVIRAWRDELHAFAGSQQYVSRIFDEAMRNLPDRPVNAPQFRRLCEQARDRVVTRSAQPHDSAPVRGPTPEERASLYELRDLIAGGGLFAKPGRGWAQKVVDAYESNTPLATALPTPVRQPDGTLRLNPPQPPTHLAYKIALQVVGRANP